MTKRRTTTIVDVCLVEDCGRVVQARGLCKTHYASLSRALKSGQDWNIRTGKVVTSPHRPEAPNLSGPWETAFSSDDLATVKHAVEVDAARLLPHALAFCIAESLSSTGLVDNPDAMAAFNESTGARALSSGPAPMSRGRQPSGQGAPPAGRRPRTNTVDLSRSHTYL